MQQEVTDTCLSKRLRAKQLHVISVDHMALKGVPILRIDITKPVRRKVLEKLILLDKVLYVHCAPPCGTTSAARNIQTRPPPLRSASLILYNNKELGRLIFFMHGLAK